MDNKCPLCGKATREGEAFCQDCQDIARYSDSIEIDEQNKKTKTHPSTRKYKNWDELDNSAKKSKKNIIIVAILVVLCLGAGTIGSYIYLQDKQSLDTEIAYWEECAAEGTQLSYSKYLVQYPEGKYSEEATLEIEKLRLKEVQDWETLRKIPSIDFCIAYIDNNPSSTHLGEAQVLLDSLYWVDALQKNTLSSYRAYIDKVNSKELLGRYDSLAYNKYDYLTLYKRLDGKELNQLKEVLTNYWDNLSSQKYQKLQQFMQPTLLTYYNKSNISRSDVVKSIQNDLKTKKIKSAKYIVDLTNLDAVVDTNGICFVKVPVKKEIIYLNKKQRNSVESDTVKLELNAKSQLQAIYK